MRYLFLIILASSLAYGDEEKVIPPSAEKACRLFVEVQNKLEKLRSENLKRSAIILGGVTLASVGLGSAIHLASVHNEKKQIEFIRRAIRLSLSPEELKAFDDYTKGNRKKISRKSFRRIVKLLIASTGVGTAVVIGIDAASEGSFKAALKNMADEFVPPIGDGTMTAYYAADPEKFMDLNKIDACAHLGADADSPSAPLLRQSVLEMHELLAQDEKDTAEVAVNDSDASINEKSDLSSGSSSKEGPKKGAKVKAE